MEDKDNIYIYTDDSDDPQISDNHFYQRLEEIKGDDPDKSGPNFSQVDPSDENYNGEQTDENSGDKHHSPFVLMLRVLMNPVEGWKSVRRNLISPERAQQGCFYPLLAVFAASQFMEKFYKPTCSLPQIIVNAVSAFVSFFFGYFAVIIFLKMILPSKSGKVFDEDFGKVFVILTLSTLCLFFTLAELFPMLWAVLIFMPLWTVYIICRGSRFLRFPYNRQTFCISILCMSIITIPIAIAWIFEVILPS